MISSYEHERDIIDCLSNSTYENPMTVREIASICGINEGNDQSCSKTRILILKAMEDFNTPVGSCYRGYYLIRSAHEMQRYLNSLLDRQVAISNRIEIVYNAFNSRV